MPGIIKSNGNNSDHSAAQSVVYNFEDINQRARSYLDSVKKQAEEIIRTAQQEADSIRETAKSQGRQEAVEQSRRESLQHLDARMQTAIPAVQAAAQQLLDQRDHWESHWEHQAVQLALMIAEKIVRREVQQDPQISGAWIRQSLELVSRQEQVTVELSPDDFATLKEQVDSIAQSLSRLAATHVVANPAIQVGECRVLTQHGEIDHRLETQLKRIQEELLG